MNSGGMFKPITLYPVYYFPLRCCFGILTNRKDFLWAIANIDFKPVFTAETRAY